MLLGPPAVMTMTSLNTWKAPVTVTMIIRPVISRVSGKVMFHRRRSGPAPSMVAAS